MNNLTLYRSAFDDSNQACGMEDIDIRNAWMTCPKQGNCSTSTKRRGMRLWQKLLAPRTSGRQPSTWKGTYFVSGGLNKMAHVDLESLGNDYLCDMMTTKQIED